MPKYQSNGKCGEQPEMVGKTTLGNYRIDKGQNECYKRAEITAFFIDIKYLVI